ncbi:MAG TPA: PEP/pyruvate-binding domain-containing protein, partial [Holophaga sp.]|nr:PEP/pyruvate-binding domain-containing protein [Holophaga sp.]
MRPDSERNPDAERHPDTERDPASAPLPHELQALFALGEAFERGEGLEAVTRLLPSALAHSDRTPADLGRVRVTLRGEQRESPGFASSPWTLHASIPLEDKPPGTLEIAFRERPSCYGEHGFHLEARKLVELAALLVGRWSEPYPQASALIPKPEWSALLDLLAEIDPNLHKRMLRRLMNHLLHLGVPGLQGMVAHFDPGIYAQRERDSHGANAPLPRRDIGGMERAFIDLIRVANLILRESELNALIRQWMRQDKLGLMALATEQRDIHLVEITEIVERFCREIRQGDPALSPSDDLNVRVALSRRFLSESLKTIRIAKAHLSIYDFGELLLHVAGPAQGNGRLGGKAAGLILASHILQQKARERPSLADLRIPKAWYLTSDGIYNFLRTNSLEDLWSIKFADIEEIRHSYPYLEQVFKQSFFSVEMRHQLQLALEDLGEGPLIVRSSSLLEDTEGAAFSGKYRSLFLANAGPLEARLDALCDAVAEVYASVFGPDAIQYRAERGLLEFVEEMGVIIQRVVGRRVGRYFFPAVAGVAFSRNEFRWSPRLKREDGLLRLVTGLGTRAVDRVGSDFPALVSPGRPEIRVNTSPDQVLRRSQSALDVINLETGRFESVPLDAILKEIGDGFPWIEKIFSIHRHGTLRRPLRGMADPAHDELIPTFDGLLESSPFLDQIRDILSVLEKAMETPVDIEFAHDGEALYLLQCRAQSRLADEGPV